MELLSHLAQRNRDFWGRRESVDFYAACELREVERLLLARFGDMFTGRVLELGCGAGRLTGHITRLGGELHGVDVSPAMVAHCRRRYPQATFTVCDLRDLSGFPRAAFDAVLAPYNALDVLDDRERRDVLVQLRSLLVEGGLLIFSCHNRAHAPCGRAVLRLLLGNPRHPLQSVRRLPLRLRNRRRLRRPERSLPGYAMRNDHTQQFGLLHYHISRDAQERQLHELGYELLGCLDLSGRAVPRGGGARDCPELHYVARR